MIRAPRRIVSSARRAVPPLPLPGDKPKSKWKGADIGIKCPPARKQALQRAAKARGLKLGPFLLLSAEFVKHPSQKLRDLLAVKYSDQPELPHIDTSAQLEMFPPPKPEGGKE